MPSVAVILPAAGQSRRFGQGEKKPYVSLAGRSVWQLSAELFWNRNDVSKVYVVVSPEDREMFREKYSHVIAFANAEVVAGGCERFESVANALACIPVEVEYVAIHDAVRPFATPAQIDAVFAEAFKTGAAMLAVPLADTLKRVNSANVIEQTIARENLWQAQTPQVFRKDILMNAYANRAQLTVPITDDAQLVEAIGLPVTVVLGSAMNFKITTKDDLDLAHAILKHRESKPSEKPVLRFGEEAQW